MESLPHGGARITFRPDNQQLVVRTGSRVDAREVGRWKELPALTQKVTGFAAVATSAEMRLLAIVRRDHVLPCDANTGQTLAKLPPRCAKRRHPKKTRRGF